MFIMFVCFTLKAWEMRFGYFASPTFCCERCRDCGCCCGWKGEESEGFVRWTKSRNQSAATPRWDEPLGTQTSVWSASKAHGEGRRAKGCLQSGRWQPLLLWSQELTAINKPTSNHTFTSPSPFFKTMIRIRLFWTRFDFLKCFILDPSLHRYIEAWHKGS